MTNELKIAGILIAIFVVVMSLLVFESNSSTSSNNRNMNNISIPIGDSPSSGTVLLPEGEIIDYDEYGRLQKIIEGEIIDKTSEKMAKEIIKKFNSNPIQERSQIIEGKTYEIYMVSPSEFYLRSSDGGRLNVERDTLGTYVITPMGHVAYITIIVCYNTYCYVV